MTRALHPWRKRFWTLIVYVFCPIGAYAMRARARACGCLNCQALLMQRRIFDAIQAAGRAGVERIEFVEGDGETTAPGKAN